MSRDPDQEPGRIHSHSEADRLAQLTKTFPQFIDHIRGKHVLDFGCGEGLQSFAMAQHGACRVTGIDIDLGSIRWPDGDVRHLSRVAFKHEIEEEDRGKYDIVISQNSMEHFSDPEKILKVMLEALKPEGKLFITFGPPWYAPYGSHMKFFTGLPWVHIFFAERTVMNVRKLFRSDGAERYVDVEAGLNKMTVKRFENLLDDSSLRVEYRSYRSVKGLDFLCAVPYVRELFINELAVIVTRSDNARMRSKRFNTRTGEGTGQSILREAAAGDN